MTNLVATPVIDWIIEPDIEHIITEDDEPVDNIPSAKLQRGLIDPLYSSNYLPRPFLADVNVGIFISRHRSPLVPDMFLSLNVELAEDWWARQHRSYFIWEFGKQPDVVVEIVSNKEGGETGQKLRDYAEMGVKYYVVYDPQLLIQKKELQVYELYVGEYLPRPDRVLAKVGLSLTIWEGTFEDKHDRWLRWCDLAGNLIPTGAERAEQERLRAEQAQAQAETERLRAEQAQAQAETERLRAEQLAARLRALGIDPDTVT